MRYRARLWAQRRFGADREARSGYRRGRPELSPVQRRIVEELRTDGIAFTSFDELVGDTVLWERLDSSMQEFAERAKAQLPDLDAPQGKTDYLIRRSRHGSRSYAIDDPWLRYSLVPEVLDVVNSLREMWMKLQDVDQWFTVPYGGSHARVGSQRWHRDPWDPNVLKVFTYFSDVTEAAGPFEYIPGSIPGGQYGDYRAWRPHARKGWLYPPQEEFEQKVPDERRIVATGRPGTMFFVNTTGFHRGGFATTDPRLLSYQTYLSPATLAAGFAKKPFFSVDGTLADAGLSGSARFALP